MALAESHLLNKRRRPGMGVALSAPPSPSSMSLVKALINLAQLVAMCQRQKICQRRNATNLSRTIKLLSPFFEEIRDSKPPLPPSAIIAFRELHITMQKAKLLLDDCNEGSCLWLLLDSEMVAQQFHVFTQELATELDSLPLELLDLTDEVREQVELVRMQVRRSKLRVDPTEEHLKNDLLRLWKGFEKKQAPDHEQLQSFFEKLQICNAKDCRKELQQLEEELSNQASVTEETYISIRSMMEFVRYSKCVLFGVSDSEETDESSRDSSTTFDVGEVSTSGSDAKAAEASLNPPDEFRCPISLDLMRDPVIVASGQTYDRASIGRWLAAGHSTCPKSGQKLVHVSLIPNYALRSLISQWCEDHHVPFETMERGSRKGLGEDHTAITSAALEATKMTAAFLVGKLATGSPEVQKQAAYELRLLAKSSSENRMCIAEAGAIPFLVPLLSSKDIKAQENSVTAFLNLSIYENNKSLILAAGALDPIVEVLKAGGSTEARENAAATLYSLSGEEEVKITIGNKPGVISALIDLLQEGTQRGKKDAATALFNLSIYPGNKPKVVEAGAVPLLVELLTDETAGLIDDALSLLVLLSGSQEGAMAIAESSVVPVLVNLLRSGTPRGKEHSVVILVVLCRGGTEFNIPSEVKDRTVSTLVNISTTISSLRTLHNMGTIRAKRKASSLLKILQRRFSPLNHSEASR